MKMDSNSRYGIGRNGTVDKWRSGFTLIEALLAVVLIAIIATVAVSQYTDFTLESKHAATRESLALIRNGIQKQYSQMKLRCGQFASNTANSGGYFWPAADTLNNNDITTGDTAAICNGTEVTAKTDRYFVAGGLPANPWSHPYCNETERRSVNTSWVNIPYVSSDPNAQGIHASANTTAEGSVTTRCGWVYDSNTGIVKTGTNYAGESAF